MTFIDSLIVVVGLVGVLFLVFILVSRTMSSLYGAPFVGIHRRLIGELLEFGGVGPDDHLLDLGCGDGRVLIGAVRERQVRQATGYEVTRWPYLKAWLARRRYKLEDRLELHRASMFKAPLGEASVIYLYLFPGLLQRVAGKIAAEARPGTRLICPSFTIDTNSQPHLTLVKSGVIGNTTTYLYEVTRS